MAFRISELFNKIPAGIGRLWRGGAFHILLGNFATKFVAFFGSVFLSRLLTKSAMGQLAYIENIYGYAFIFASLGLSNALLRYSVLADTREHKYAFFRFSLQRGFTFDVLLVLTITILNLFYPHPEQFGVAGKLIPLYLVSLPFSSLITQVQMNERAMQNNRRYAIVSVMAAILLVGARLLGASTSSVTGVVWGIVGVTVVFGTVLLLNARSHYFRGIKADQLTIIERRQALSYSIQYMITNGLWAIMMLTNMFLLNQLVADPTQAADYRIAYAFPANLAIISSSIGIFVTPHFVKNENNVAWVRENYKKTLLLNGAAMMGTAGVMWLLARPLLWFFGEQYYNVVPLMRWLIVGTFVDTALRFPSANILASVGKIRANMLVAFFGFVSMTLLNLWLIPKYGAYGIAYSTIIVQFGMAMVLFLVINSFYGVLARPTEKGKLS